jgi:hypothetical protein
MASDGQPLMRPEHEGWMRKIPITAICGSLAAGFVIAASVVAFMGVTASPASAGSVNCNYQACGQVGPSITVELAAQTKRPRVTIYRRRTYPGPNAVRQCRSWLVTEYRISGPVIVPQMRCWWE